MADNIEILNKTLEECTQGWYNGPQYLTKLKLVPPRMREAKVFLPEDIKSIENAPSTKYMGSTFPRNDHRCVNKDSYTLALEVKKEYPDDDVLVLNFSNQVNPGGGVRKGAKAQEEDLCRRSSLLLSLESKDAEAYYKYNKSLKTYLGSDAIILHPNVEVFKDIDGNCLDESVVVSVLTCAAPMVTEELGGLSKEQYEALLYNRIKGILTIAAEYGYKRLVLGAWGCGAFGNDAEVVARIFYNVIKEFRYNNIAAESIFAAFYFAVMDNSKSKYNFNAFQKYFDGQNFYKEDDDAEKNEVLERIKATEVCLDKIRGSLFGGAMGDALGYAIEFASEEQIFSRYGKNGISEYDLDEKTGKALISDDTQMTLFTANGMLVGETRLCLRGIGGIPHTYIVDSYKDWLYTQEMSIEQMEKKRKDGYYCTSWICDVPELYSRRAPGNTCLSAMRARKDEYPNSYLDNPINNSKGCGGIMRVAPLALHYGNVDPISIAMEAAEISAITHGHSLGYMTSAVLDYIIHCLLYPIDGNNSLKDIVLKAKDEVCNQFKDDEHVRELKNIIDLAVELSENFDTDLNNIHKLGEGWVAEETLAIAIYCSLKYQNDFSTGIIVAVNHNGDSDSTGAVTGNIIGAIVGYEAIEDKWKENLEIADVIEEMAVDICHGCQMDEYGKYRDDAWMAKYGYMRRRPEDVNK